MYLEIRLQPMAYQDDIMRASKSIEDARAGVTKLEAMAESKNLNYNVNKSCLIIMGPKKKTKNIEKELEDNPILLSGVPMKVKSKEKYLGEILCSGLAESIDATVDKRKGQALLAINEIASIVNDTRAKTIGGIEVATEIWDLAILPYLLNSSGTWIGMKKSTLEKMNRIQNKFLQRILQVTSAVIPLMYWDLGQMIMVNQILKRKLLLIHHISHLDTNSLAFKVYQQEKLHGLPGLFQEVKEELSNLGITIKEMEGTTKTEWKVIVKKITHDKNEQDLLNMMKPCKG